MALLHEFSLLLALVGAVVGFTIEPAILGAGQVAIGASVVFIIALIIACAFRVAHHAEHLAQHFGEPYGTMILTIAAVAVEVVMLAILMSSGNNPTLARDTVYAAVMIDINGIIGIAAIIGGIRHGEQKYNMDSSHAYLAMLLVAIGVAMFIPNFIGHSQWQVYSFFTIIITILLYIVFLRVQTVEHRYFFQWGKRVNHDDSKTGSVTLSVIFLIASIVVIGILSELLSVFIDHSITESAFPKAIIAVLVALISASPEILTAIRAAHKDQMQTVLNIALGASLATVLLTIPIIEAIALFTNKDIEMALTPLQSAMLFITLLTAMITTHDGESNVLEGAVHFALFCTFIMLTFAI